MTFEPAICATLHMLWVCMTLHVWRVRLTPR